MEKYFITKEQILAIEKVGGADVSLYLKETFPEVFKTELEVGKWYKMKGDIHFLCNFNGNIGNNGNSYGFNLKGEWMDNSMCFQNSDTYLEATPEEVVASLISEAKKRGFKNGEWCKFGNSGMIRKLDSDCVTWVEDWGGIGIGGLSIGGNIIFSDGEWVEIIPQEKTVVPMDKALKIIAKKMKVSPENIEIQS